MKKHPLYKPSIFRQEYESERMKGKDLDDFLAKGWFRSGQQMTTTHLSRFGNHIFSPVRTRLSLKNYQFKKRLRRLLRKNKERFYKNFGTLDIDWEKEKLYHLYSERFDDLMPFSLEEYLMSGSNEDNCFETLEARVYDEDKLVAVSFFDVGNNSVASIFAIFHPEYHKYSLGIFTLLLEIEYALEKGMHYHYSGYIIPGYPKFDYKMRVGELEFFDIIDEEWKLMPFLDVEKLPASVLFKKTEAFIVSFNKLVMPFTDYSCSVIDMDRLSPEIVCAPRFVCCNQSNLSKRPIIVEYDLIRGLYVLSQAKEYSGGRYIPKEIYLQHEDPELVSMAAFMLAYDLAKPPFQ